jgi:quercetin dioxygenase-like cupin family protein
MERVKSMASLPSATDSVIIVPPGSRPSISMGGTSHVFNLVSQDTSGQLSLMEATIQPHTLVMPHHHTHEDELLIALEGEAGLRVGEQEMTISAGFVVFIPRGVVHALWNATDAPSKGFSIFTPGGLESYFEEMSAALRDSRPPDGARLGAIGGKYGVISHLEWVPELSAKYGLKLG